MRSFLVPKRNSQLWEEVGVPREGLLPEACLLAPPATLPHPCNCPSGRDPGPAPQFCGRSHQLILTEGGSRAARAGGASPCQIRG